MSELLLGVNIDHIATVRNARGTKYPSPVQAALIAEQAGADGITVHLREDRRHISDSDIFLIYKTIQTRMNLEIALTDEMIAIACKIKPHFVCLVPEKRQELTTEGGLDITKQYNKINAFVQQLSQSGIGVSLFINADHRQIEAAAATGAPYIELHTGLYASKYEKNLKHDANELELIRDAASFASSLKLKINAGHGLNYYNVQPIAAIPEINELNIGHAIIGRALFIGLDNAVKEMKQLIREARN
ncbi:pyridoxine 5'-phosphate synthase [Pantoea sp. Aalb]|uniref:pyridoxine 5'-phosphate synthase n=1 Tax=Pantoea sp. Aalb TaxID=2576762 RepID=UPI0013241AF3|nr:pyridoxine 5'-phosphate synthase [Pantoea sp. Aalb]MXP67246.1 pyridoxine 5'-phosphate synthase [Pantoea sp. Aalb]